MRSFGHLFHKGLSAVHLKAVELLTDLEGIAVKSPHDGESVTAEFLIVEQRPAHVAYADQRGTPFTVGIETGLDDFQQIGDIIPHTANAEFAEVGEILTNLGGIDVASPGQGFGRNNLNAILVHGFKNLEIGGEPLNGSARNMFVFGSLVHRLGRLKE